MFDEADESTKKIKARNILRHQSVDKNYHIVKNEALPQSNKYTKDGLNLMSVDQYLKSIKKSDVDMVFLQNSVLESSNGPKN